MYETWNSDVWVNICTSLPQGIITEVSLGCAYPLNKWFSFSGLYWNYLGTLDQIRIELAWAGPGHPDLGRAGQVMAPATEAENHCKLKGRFSWCCSSLAKITRRWGSLGTCERWGEYEGMPVDVSQRKWGGMGWISWSAWTSGSWGGRNRIASKKDKGAGVSKTFHLACVWQLYCLYFKLQSQGRAIS